MGAHSSLRAGGIPADDAAGRATSDPKGTARPVPAPAAPAAPAASTAPPAPTAPTAPSRWSSGGSPKFSSARRRTASRAAAACGPRARTRISSPQRTPRVATAFRLRALTGPRPAVTSATVTSASNPAAVRTNSAAGRAWRPSRFATTRRRVGPSAAGAVRKACAGAPSTSSPLCIGAPVAAGAGCAVSACCSRWAALAASPPRASSATFSREPPSRAATAAATAPSTNGASVSRMRSRRSRETRSRAISADSTALPRSMSTRTPSSDQASSMARATSAASVPSGLPGWSRPPATAIRRPSPPICAASSATPSASCALWLTRTSPITAPPSLAHTRTGPITAPPLREQREPVRSRLAPATSAVAAVSSRSHDEVAPGS